MGSRQGRSCRQIAGAKAAFALFSEYWNLTVGGFRDSRGKDRLPGPTQLSNIGGYMRRETMLHAFVLTGLMLLFLPPVLSYNEYVRVVKGTVNIRSGPSTRAAKVGSAKQGDTFELVGEDGNWYEVELFSGGQRFLYKSLAKVVSYRPEVPEDVEIRRQVFQEWKEIGNRAKAEADRTYPPERNLERNLRHEQLLGDRYRLELLQKLGVQPPAYRRILIEGYRKGW
jgi:hypothetical protein